MVFVIEAKDIANQTEAVVRWLNMAKIPRAYKIDLLTSYKALTLSDNPEYKRYFCELYQALDELKI